MSAHPVTTTADISPEAIETLLFNAGINAPYTGVDGQLLVVIRDLRAALTEAQAQLAQFDGVVIPAWKREEFAWDEERERLRSALTASEKATAAAVAEALTQCQLATSRKQALETLHGAILREQAKCQHNGGCCFDDLAELSRAAMEKANG